MKKSDILPAVLLLLAEIGFYYGLYVHPLDYMGAILLSSLLMRVFIPVLYWGRRINKDNRLALGWQFTGFIFMPLPFLFYEVFTKERVDLILGIVAAVTFTGFIIFILFQ